MNFYACVCAAAALAAGAGYGIDRAIDLASADVRARLPRFTRASYTCAVVEDDWSDGRWAFRYQITRPWMGELPQWPSVDLPATVTDWSSYNELVIDVFNAGGTGDTLGIFIAPPEGRVQVGLEESLALQEGAFQRWRIPLHRWPKTMDRCHVGRLHFFTSAPVSADVYLCGFYLLRRGEEAPPPAPAFLEGKVRPAQVRREQRQQQARSAALTRFIAACRAAGQMGAHAWFAQATSMEKVRPRGETIDVAPARAFSLALARGERESLQVLVMPSHGDLTNVMVVVTDLARADGAPAVFPRTAWTCAPVGYVETVAPAPYLVGRTVATNTPPGYMRERVPAAMGWWPDPILDHLASATVRGSDLQSFWVRARCPDDQPSGVYTGCVAVCGAGWREGFPLTVRVWDFAVPKASPLPLALTFSPEPSMQFATPAQERLNADLRHDPASPINAWKRHALEWGDFLADYYITMDSLYHNGEAIRWDVLLRLKAQGRLGCFNLGYWSYVPELTDAAQARWLADIHKRFDANVAKARALGLLDHAYLYGCDEINTNYFPQIAWSVAQLKKAYPGVPIATTAYDHAFGVGTPLEGIDWFTPLTPKYEEHLAQIPVARAAGHQVWWYICCGPHAPYANNFIECPAIEVRMLMGAQTAKYRPDGFLYYQLSIWNARHPIDGPETFTDWEARSWTRYHGDGSWCCCGPDGRPCATIRLENFRDGLEDYAYAREYTRVTGRACPVPESLCRSMKNYVDDPQALYAWRASLAEAIEAAKTKGVK